MQFNILKSIEDRSLKAVLPVIFALISVIPLLIFFMCVIHYGLINHYLIQISFIGYLTFALLGYILLRKIIYHIIEISSESTQINLTKSVEIESHNENELKKIVNAFHTLLEHFNKNTNNLDKRIEELASLRKFTEVSSTTLNIKELYEYTLEKIMITTDAKYGSIMSISSDGKSLVLETGRGLEESMESNVEIDINSTILGRVLKDDKTLVSNDPSKEEGFNYLNDAAFSGGPFLVKVIKVRGKTIGVLNIARGENGKQFEDSEVDYISTALGQIAFASDNSLLINEKEKAYDELKETHEKNITLEKTVSINQIIGSLSEKAVHISFHGDTTDYIKKPHDTTIAKELIIKKEKEENKKKEKNEIQETLEDTERDIKELINLDKISSSFEISSDSKEILHRLTILSADSMNCEVASILLINERENVLEFIVATGEKQRNLETMSIPINEGIAGWVATHGEAQIVNDTSKDDRFTGEVDKQLGFVSRKILAVPLHLENKILGVLEVINTKDNRNFTEKDVRVLGEIGRRTATLLETTRTIENHQNFFQHTINILIVAIERKDPFSKGISWKVAELCHAVSNIINLTEISIRDLHFGALLHDIGKLEMPTELFNKRKLSERQFKYIKQHPIIGAKMLEPIAIMKPIVPLVLYHHESWDGSGFPFGISGNRIPLGARIINLAEAYCVMSSHNSYKKQMKLEEAIQEIKSLSGKKFDPELVKVFVDILKKESSLDIFM